MTSPPSIEPICEPPIRSNRLSPPCGYAIAAPKANGSRTACLTMVFKLVQSAAKRWRLLNGSELLPDVINGVPFQDGLRAHQAAA